MNFFKFEIIHKSSKSKARVGKIYTPHGTIDTPNFVGVGTNGTMKMLDNLVVDSLGLQLMFCNTYHLMVHPGEDVVFNAGGIHKFINRKSPIITDSGGFQVFSLAYGSVKDELKSRGTKSENNSVLKINEEGVLFRSYRDGSKILLTPETSIQAQKKIGADIIIPFDELPPYHIDSKSLLKSFERTHRWEIRSLKEHKKNINNQAIYAVIHGGTDKILRKKSCTILAQENFDGFAIGGSIGKNHEEMFDMLSDCVNFIPENRPNHLLGIGDLTSLKECIKFGLDTFDSSYPTKCARHGQIFTFNGGIKINSSKYKQIFEPIDKNCDCFTCTNYTLSYIHHLYKSNEAVGLSLATIHNISFMIKLMSSYRQEILNNNI